MAEQTFNLKYNKSYNQIPLNIQNAIFKQKIIKEINPIGFIILTYLLLESRNALDVSITLNMISEFTKIKTPSTVTKYLNILETNNLIVPDHSFNEVNKNSRIIIDLTPYYQLSGGFERIPSSIFIDNYQNMNEVSWSIFCLLAMMYHPDYKSSLITQKKMMETLGITDKRTLTNNIQILIDLNLISVKYQSKHYINKDEFEVEEDKLGSTTTKYIVNYLFKS